MRAGFIRVLYSESSGYNSPKWPCRRDGEVASERRHSRVMSGFRQYSSGAPQVRDWRLQLSSVPDRAPDAFGCRRHIDVAYPQRTQGIDNCVQYHRRGGGSAGFAAALDAKRVGRGWGFFEIERHIRHIACPGHRVIEKRTRQQLSVGWIVCDKFTHRLT